MFLRCSYCIGNLSLNVLMNMVLTQKNQCMTYAKPNKLGLALPSADRRDARTAINWSVTKPRKRQTNWLFGKHNQDKTAGR